MIRRRMRPSPAAVQVPGQYALHRCYAAPIGALTIAFLSMVWAPEMTSCTPVRRRVLRGTFGPAAAAQLQRDTVKTIRPSRRADLTPIAAIRVKIWGAKRGAKGEPTTAALRPSWATISVCFSS
jgi:hypothetical protein